MYIYRLDNFIEKESILFSEKGQIILGYGYPNPSWVWFTKNGTEVYANTAIQEVRSIDFNKLPEDIQGLFLIYKKLDKHAIDIPFIKKSLGYYKWKKFLANSIIVYTISNYPEQED